MASDASGKNGGREQKGREQKNIRTKPSMKRRPRTDAGASLLIRMRADPTIYTPVAHFEYV